MQRDDALDDHPAEGDGDTLRGGLEVVHVLLGLLLRCTFWRA